MENSSTDNDCQRRCDKMAAVVNKRCLFDARPVKCQLRVAGVTPVNGSIHVGHCDDSNWHIMILLEVVSVSGARLLCSELNNHLAVQRATLLVQTQWRHRGWTTSWNDLHLPSFLQHTTLLPCQHWYWHAVRTPHNTTQYHVNIGTGTPAVHHTTPHYYHVNIGTGTPATTPHHTTTMSTLVLARRPSINTAASHSCNDGSNADLPHESSDESINNTRRPVTLTCHGCSQYISVSPLQALTHSLTATTGWLAAMACHQRMPFIHSTCKGQ